MFMFLKVSGGLPVLERASESEYFLRSKIFMQTSINRFHDEYLTSCCTQDINRDACHCTLYRAMTE